ncbi:MAG: InlB B-repeat-containing protein, partial [Oscillospiraceae bacterium]|nr:InlB B-repeat-containing protein [Oscillospiraceae bacterium]
MLKSKTGKMKRIAALVLVMVFMLSLAPSMAFAYGEEDGSNPTDVISGGESGSSETGGDETGGDGDLPVSANFYVNYFTVDVADGAPSQYGGTESYSGLVGDSVYDDSYAKEITGYTYSAGYYDGKTEDVIVENDDEGNGTVLGLYYLKDEPSPSHKYVIKFVVDGEVVATIDDYIPGSPVAAPADPAAPQGKVFDGWSVDLNTISSDDFIQELPNPRFRGAVTDPVYVLTITAEFEDGLVISFYNGNELFSKMFVVKGQTIGANDLPAAPVQGSSLFLGWSPVKDATEYTGWDDITVGDSSISLYAIYSKEDSTFTVTYYNYDSNGTLVIEDIDTVTGGTVSVPAYAVNSSDSKMHDGTWKFIVNAPATLDATALATAAPMTEDITVYGNLAIVPGMSDYFTVTFDSAGGVGSTTGKAVPAQYVLSGGKANAPDTITKANAAFDGWFTGATKNAATGEYNFSAATAYNFTGNVTGNLLLTAKWNVQKTQYTVKYWVERPDALTAIGGTTTIANAATDNRFDPGTDTTNYAFVGSAVVTTGINASTKAATVTDNNATRTLAGIGFTNTAGYQFRHISLENEVSGAPATTTNTSVNVTIAADGSTVVNVYYRLTVYTLQVDFNNYPANASTGSYAAGNIKHPTTGVTISAATGNNYDYYIYAKREQSLSSVFPHATGAFDGWMLLNNSNGSSGDARYKNPFATFNSTLYNASTIGTGTTVSLGATWANDNRRRFTVHYMLQDVDNTTNIKTTTTTTSYTPGKLLRVEGTTYSSDGSGYFTGYTAENSLQANVANLRQGTNTGQSDGSGNGQVIYVPEESSIQQIIPGYELVGTAHFASGNYSPLALPGTPNSAANSWYGGTLTGQNNNYNINNPVHIYVYYNLKKYPLNVYSAAAYTEAGSELRYNNTSVTYTSDIKSALDGAKTGDGNPGGEYTFGGWYYDAACSQPFLGSDYAAATMPAPLTGKTAVNLYAKWVKNAGTGEYNVYFHQPNGDLIAGLTSSAIKEGLALNSINGYAFPTSGAWLPAGATFVKWVDSREYEWKLTDTSYSDVHLYARYTLGLAVTFMNEPFEAGKSDYTQFASVAVTTPSKTLGSTLPGGPTVDGETFVGWYKADGTQFTGTTKVTSSLTVYPKFTPTVVTVTFDGNGGTPSFPSKTGAVGAAIGSLPTATRTGYTLSGWYTASTGGTKIETTTPVPGNVTYYAQWAIDPNQTYTITYATDGNGTTTPPTETKQVLTDPTGSTATAA